MKLEPDIGILGDVSFYIRQVCENPVVPCLHDGIKQEDSLFDAPKVGGVAASGSDCGYRMPKTS